MAELKNELSWSFSRDRIFRECKRAYYYYYYASWGGWERNANKLSQKAYILKKMKNIDMWAGEIVHQVIKWVLDNKIKKRNITCQEAEDRAKVMINKGLQESKNKIWQISPKWKLNLYEHYYNKKITQEEIERKLERKVYRSIKNFYSLSFLKNLEGVNEEDYLQIESVDSFLFGGVKVFTSPDFALKKDFYYLYDWKTGLPGEDDFLQLSCYGLYATEKWKVPLEKIKVIPVYLTNEIVEFVPFNIDIEQTKSYISESIEQMKLCLSDIESNSAQIGSFPKTAEEWRCKNCFFQEICLRSLKNGQL